MCIVTCVAGLGETVSATTRTHIIVPKQLIGAIDEMVGSRGRSRFFVEAADEANKIVLDFLGRHPGLS